MKKYLVLLFSIIYFYAVSETKPYPDAISVRVPKFALFHGRGQNMMYPSDENEDYADSGESYRINSIGNGRNNINNVTITSMDAKERNWTEEESDSRSREEVSGKEINSIGNGKGNVNYVVINSTHHRRHKKKPRYLNVNN